MKNKKMKIFSSLVLLVTFLVAGSAIAAPKIIEEDPQSITGTVRFWSAFNAAQGMGDMVAAFNEIYPNIEVTINQYSNTSNGNVGVDTALMAGGQIDVLLNYNSTALSRRALAGLFMPLDDLMATDGIDLVEEWGTDVYRFNDTTFSLPMGGERPYVAINMDAWNEAGLGELPIEWTWDEYIEASRQMTTANRFGGSDYHSIQFTMYPVRQALGQDALYNAEGLSNFDHPLFREALEQKYRAEVEEKIWFPLTRYRSESMQTQMVLLDGSVASGIITNLTRFVRDTETYPIDFKFGFAPYPTMEPGQGNHLAGGSMFSHLAVTRNAADKDAAWAFTKWFATHGSVYLAVAGHAPTWRDTDISNATDLVFGSREAAAELVDVESFERVVFKTDGSNYTETNLTAYTELHTIMNEIYLRCFNGEISIDDALEEMKERGDEAILDVL